VGRAHHRKRIGLPLHPGECAFFRGLIEAKWPIPLARLPLPVQGAIVPTALALRLLLAIGVYLREEGCA